MAGRSYSLVTIKQLFALSGNRCYFPGCRVPVIAPGNAAVLGEIAHVRALRPSGARFEPQLSHQDRNALSNLILLCPSHHALIDRIYPDRYSADVIIRWKQDREAQVGESVELEDEVARGLILTSEAPSRTSGLSPATKVHLVAAMLTAGRIPFAFTGGLALAYVAGEPRGRADLDVVLFPTVDHRLIDRLRAAFWSVVVVSDEDERALIEVGQRRLWWDRAPLDLFLNVNPYFQQIRTGVRRVPLGGSSIPIVSGHHLAVAKALFGRPKDWDDIKMMVWESAIDLDAVKRDVSDLVGPNHSAVSEIARLIAQRTELEAPGRSTR